MLQLQYYLSVAQLKNYFQKRFKIVLQCGTVQGCGTIQLSMVLFQQIFNSSTQCHPFWQLEVTSLSGMIEWQFTDIRSLMYVYNYIFYNCTPYTCEQFTRFWPSKINGWSHTMLDWFGWPERPDKCKLFTLNFICQSMAHWDCKLTS